MPLSVELIKQHKRVMISRFGKSDNIKGLTQVLTTLVHWRSSGRWASSLRLVSGGSLQLQCC